MDGILDIFDPLPPLWTILLNKAYVVIWTFGNPPLPYHVHMVHECPLRNIFCNRLYIFNFYFFAGTDQSEVFKWHKICRIRYPSLYSVKQYERTSIGISVIYTCKCQTWSWLINSVLLTIEIRSEDVHFLRFPISILCITGSLNINCRFYWTTLLFLISQNLFLRDLNSRFSFSMENF